MAPLGAGETSLGQSSSFGLAREAAVEATCLWLEGKYESCLETLERLDLNQMPPAGDIKVQHNIAIVGHYCAGRVEPDKLLGQLAKTITDASVRMPEHPTSGQKGATASSPMPPSTDPPLGRPFDETSVCKVNKAVVLYEARRFAEATDLLSPLLASLDVLDEGAALHVCVLLLDMQLQQQHVKQASATLTALERVCPGLQDSFLCDTCEPQSTTEAGPGARQGTPAAGMPRLPPALVLPSVSKWRSSTMDAARRLLVQHGHVPPAPPSLGALMRLYRARTAMAAGDLEAAARSVRGLVLERTSCCGATCGPLSLPETMYGLTHSATGTRQAGTSTHKQSLPPAAVLAKAQLDVMNGLTEEALHAVEELLVMHRSMPYGTADANLDLTPMSAVLLNDLGLIHSSSGRHVTAAGLFDNAARAMMPQPNSRFSSIAGTSGTIRMFHAPALGHLAASYNAGVQHQVTASHANSLACFRACLNADDSTSEVASITASGRRPLLELRAAQAAVGLYAAQQCSSVAMQPATDTSRTSLRAGDVSLLADALVWAESSCVGLKQLQAMQTMGADVCESAETVAGTGTSHVAQTSWLGHRWSDLYAAAHATAAYVHMLAGRYQEAADAAQSALAVQNGSQDFVAAAACIAAESFRALCRVSDADDVLAAHMLRASPESAALPGSVNGAQTKEAQRTKALPPSSRAALSLNMAVAHAHDVPRAASLAFEAHAQDPRSRDPALVSIYMHMMSGRSLVALKQLQSLAQ